MQLKDYFDGAQGVGVLATADAQGKVNLAIYARPHFNGSSEDELAFLMRERLSYQNVQENPHAAYLFLEQGEGYVGRRLFLTKTREEADPERIRQMRRRALPPECDQDDTDVHVVHFRIDGVRPLVGG